ncbi:MAG: DUF6427 family protein [Bacteroidota bacterium]
MILQRLKSNDSFNLLIFPVIALAFWLKDLLEPYLYSYFSGETENIFYTPLFRLVGEQPFWHVLVSLVMVIILGFVMQLVNDRYLFIRIRTKLPAILFVIIIAGFTKIHTLHPVYFAALFLLFSIFRFFSIFEKSKPYSAVFDTGLLLAVGSLFYFNLIIFLPAFLLSIIILTREISWREYVIMILGFLFPFVFVFSYFFYVGEFTEKIDIFLENILTPVSHFRTNYALHGYLTVLILLTLFGSITLLQQYDTKKVSSRKYFSVFFLIFIFSLISFAFIPATSQEMLVINAIPVTYLVSNIFVFMKSRFWSELLFSLLLAIVIIMQFFG